MIKRSEELTKALLQEMRWKMDNAGYREFPSQALKETIGYVLYDDETDTPMSVTGNGSREHPHEVAAGSNFYRVEEFLGKLAVQRQTRVWFLFNVELYSLDPVTGEATEEIQNS